MATFVGYPYQGGNSIAVLRDDLWRNLQILKAEKPKSSLIKGLEKMLNLPYFYEEESQEKVFYLRRELSKGVDFFNAEIAKLQKQVDDFENLKTFYAGMLSEGMDDYAILDEAPLLAESIHEEISAIDANLNVLVNRLAELTQKRKDYKFALFVLGKYYKLFPKG